MIHSANTSLLGNLRRHVNSNSAVLTLKVAMWMSGAAVPRWHTNVGCIDTKSAKKSQVLFF